LRFPSNSRSTRRLAEIGAVCGIGLLIASIIGFLQDPSPAADDGFYYVGMTKALVSGFPYLFWDPHLFAGYVPTIGLSWVTFSIPVAIVGLGFDAISAFHVSFVGAFLLFGLSIFYFARTVGSGRMFAFSMVILAWSTTAYWNNAVWGGAYNRVFTIPFMFFTLGSTYRYASHLNLGEARNREYLLCLGLWVLTYLGDVFVSIAATVPGAIFLLLSAGSNRLSTGLKRSIMVFLPVLGITIWQVVPILTQALKVGPYRLQYTGAVSLTSLLVPGSMWVSTLNYVYLPLFLALSLPCFLFRLKISWIETAFLGSLAVMGSYWVIMGWVPSLWPYVPRLMATYSSVENLAWIFLLAFPVFFAVLRRHLAGVGGILFSVRFKRPFPISARGFLSIISVLALLFVVSDALIVLPGIKSVHFESFSDQLNIGLNSGVGPPSNDYRVSLQNRFLTRSFMFYQPNRFDTGGRVENVDPNPFFNNWYLTDVFYKNDLSLIAGAYVEDRPSSNVSSLIESSYNFAGENFWLDWYGVNGVAFYSYALRNTVENYTARPMLFSTVSVPMTSGVPEVLIKPANPSSILVATNASIIGFYSASSSSQDEYYAFISILARMGLNSQFIIPLYLQSTQDLISVPMDLLVTDSYTYSAQAQQMQSMFKTSNIVVVSSTDGAPGSGATTSPEGGRLLVTVPLSFSQLVNGGEVSAYFFVRSGLQFPIQSINVLASTYYPATVMMPQPSSWFASYRTTNAQGTLQSSGNTLNLNLTNNDTTRRLQFNIQSHLPAMVPLSSNLTVSLSIQTTANITLGVSFSSPPACCSNYVGIDTSVNPGSLHQFQIPYSRFQEWGNSSAMFGVSQDLNLAVNLPPGESDAYVKLANVSIADSGYSVSTLSTPLPSTGYGILEYNATIGGVGLINQSNASTAVLNLSSNRPDSIITLSSLSGGQTGERYDRIITIEGSGPVAPMVALFSPSSWSPVHEDWTTNQNMVAPLIPHGFRGLLWKETNSPLWKFEPASGAPPGPLTYYYAGPGMIYIPMLAYAEGIKATFLSINAESVTLFSIPIATIAALVVLRVRIPAFGHRDARITKRVEKS